MVNKLFSIILLPMACLAQTAALGAEKSANIEIKTLEVTVDKGKQKTEQKTGVTTIGKDDFKKMPVTNDLAEIIRKQPGVALTTASTSGQYGNKRQISLRGMGPENTLILIDGKPVLSRNAIRMGWRGDRNTRGDTNWVPAEMVDSIQLIRGPQATIYGNGAAGGVIDIITKKASDKWTGSLNLSYTQPQDSKEGKGQSYNFNLMGPLSNSLSLRIYGNYVRTEPDAWDINRNQTKVDDELYDETIIDSNGNSRYGKASYYKTFIAGREGLVNKDYNALLTWQLNPNHSLNLEIGSSKQNNLYSGESAFNLVQKGDLAKPDKYSGIANIIYRGTDVSDLLGSTTNALQRDTLSLSHNASWTNRLNQQSFIQLEETKLEKYMEGLSGGAEGTIDADLFNGKPNLVGTSSKLRNLTFKSQAQLSVDNLLWSNHLITAGIEFNHSRLIDNESMTQKMRQAGFSFNVSGFDPEAARDPKMSAVLSSIFARDEIDFGQGTIISPAFRFDHHDKLGSQFSPALNLEHSFNQQLSLQAGVGQSYKAPNLYQINPNYLLFSRGNGCFYSWPRRSPCFLQGNAKLKPESSINAEIGINWDSERIGATLSLFRNDYRNKIEAGTIRRRSENTYSPAGFIDLTSVDIYRWANVRKSLTEGLEASLRLTSPNEKWEWRNNFTYMHRYHVYDKDLGSALVDYVNTLDEAEQGNLRNYDILGVMPRFTLVSNLSWQPTPAWLFSLTATYYGKQLSPRLNDRNIGVNSYDPNKDLPGYEYFSDLVTNDRQAYAIFDLAFSYQHKEYLTLFGGIKNLADKRFYRLGNTFSASTGTTPDYTKGAGANTYNEPGRSFYLGLNLRF